MPDYQAKQVKRLIENFGELDKPNQRAVLDAIKYQGIMSAAEQVAKTKTVLFGDLYPELIERQKYFNSFEGLSTGLIYFDDAIMGLRPGELIILAGPSNFGKTMVGLNIVVNAAVQTKLKVLIISMEMTPQQIGDRVLQMTDNLDPLMENFIVQTQLSVSVSHIAAMIDRHKPDLVLLDHVQFLALQETGSEYERITKAVAGLKRLANTKYVPIIAISHINKTRGGKDGQATADDLKGSASIEQDCDVGIMLNRPAGSEAGDTIILTLFKHRNKRPNILRKECELTMEGVRLAHRGMYKRFA